MILPDAKDPALLEPAFRTDLLKSVMRERKMSCRQVGDLVGRKQATVRQWRWGERLVIPHTTMVAFLALLPAEGDA